MEVLLRPDLETKLSQLAASQGRPAQSLVEEAIERLVEYDDWFTAQINKGIATADRGELIEHAEVRKMFNKRFPKQ